MQVPFVSASTAFRHAKHFIKQPGANASINSDPLTLRVPENGTKSDRLLTHHDHGAADRIEQGFDFGRHFLHAVAGPEQRVQIFVGNEFGDLRRRKVGQ